MNQALIVTGGARGIGAEVAKLAAECGYAVCVNYRHDRTAADKVVQHIREHGGKSIAVRADVSSEADVCRLFRTVDDQLGQLTALVNNAGVLEKQQSLDQIDAARLMRIFSINVFGSFLCSREAVRRMAHSKDGSGGGIVNISSVAARLGAPHEYIDYAASKAAIETMTIGLAKEVAHEGIRVNCVRPGVIRTEIHANGGEPDRVNRVSKDVPMKRGGEPIEVARAVMWLLAPASSYTTGSILEVTGGR